MSTFDTSTELRMAYSVLYFVVREIRVDCHSPHLSKHIRVTYISQSRFIHVKQINLSLCSSASCRIPRDSVGGLEDCVTHKPKGEEGAEG